MSLNASKVKRAPRKNRAPALEPGGYPARIVQVVALGLQPQQPYQGQEKPPTYEIMVTYELLDEFMPDEEGNENKEQPRWFSENFALHSLDSDLAKSTKRYFALDPEKQHGGDWTKLLNTPCMVTLIAKPSKKDETVIYNNITSVSALRKKDADKAPPLVNEALWFDIDAPDMDTYWKLPEWIREKIEGNLEFEGSILEEAIAANPKPEKTDDGKKPKAKDEKVSSKTVDTSGDTDEEDDEVDW